MLVDTMDDDNPANPDQPSGQQVPQTTLNQTQGLVHGAHVIQPLASDQPTLPAAPSVPTALPPSQAVNLSDSTQTVVPATTPATIAAAIYPAVPEHTGPRPDQQPGPSFVTGSQIPVERPKTPFGVYVIAGLNLLSVIAVFVDDYKAGTLYTIAMLINLVLAIGLLMRVDIIRKIYIGLSALTVVLVILAFVGIADTKHKLDVLRTNYDVSVSRLNTANLTDAQKAEMQIMPQLLDEIQKKNDKLFAIAYIRLSAEAVVAITCMIYLTRPKVRAAFVPLQP